MAATSHESLKAPSHRVRIESQKEIADGVFYMRTARPFDFLPGQCVALSIDPEGPVRYYSIASGSSEKHIGILYDLVPKGRLTPRLSSLRTGDEISMSDPFGDFVDDDGATVWIATGTGIAPFLSFARSLPASTVSGVKRLVHGGRALDRFYFREELRERLGGHFFCCCSRCSDADAHSGSDIYDGRLTEWLRASLEGGALSPGPRYFLCGAAGMVVEVRDILIAAEVPFTDILSEIYF